MKYFEVLGNIAAIAGILVCAAAGAARLAGHYSVFGFQTITLFIGGIAIMVMACLAKLHSLNISSSEST